jgi:TIR domain
MTKEEAVRLLAGRRFPEWNSYRKLNPGWIPDLTGADFSRAFLYDSNLPAPDLTRALLMGATFPTEDSRFLYTRNGDFMSGALVDIDTVFPASFDPIRVGATFITKSESSGVVATSSPVVSISYAWADEKVVLAIDQWLRIKRINTRIDRRDFFAGSRIRDEIVRVFQGSDVIIVMYSEKARDKPWPEFERNLVFDLEMEAKVGGGKPPRIIYVVVDDAKLPSATERARLAVMAKGKRFELVCEEIYHAILQLPKAAGEINLDEWKEFSF